VKSIWYIKNNHPSTNFVNYKTQDSKSFNNVLSIKNISIKNSGVYKCMAENVEYIVHKDYSILVVERK